MISSGSKPHCPSPDYSFIQKLYCIEGKEEEENSKGFTVPDAEGYGNIQDYSFVFSGNVRDTANLQGILGI